jgi:3-oxoadipate enol-lactonase
MNATYKSGEAWLAYRDMGEGLPVIFLHPTPLDSEYWRPVAERLPGVRAILPDLRGHGRSELGAGLPVGGFTLEPEAPVLSVGQLAEDILTLLDKLGLQKAVFVGSSIGGYVLLELWRRAPRRMRGLGFVCSKPQPDTPANLPKRAAIIRQAREAGTAAIYDGMISMLIGATTHGRSPEIEEELRTRMVVSAEGLTAVQAGLATRPNSVPTVATITAPVLAIHGGEDPSVAAAEMEAYKKAPGGCVFHELRDVGHFAAYEQPDRVAEWIEEWLAQFKKK